MVRFALLSYGFPPLQSEFGIVRRHTLVIDSIVRHRGQERA